MLLILNCSRYIGMPWGVDRNGETSNRVEKNNVREKDMVKKIGKLHEYIKTILLFTKYVLDYLVMLPLTSFLLLFISSSLY